MAPENRTPNVLVKAAGPVGWLAAAVGVGVYWALAETLIHRGLYATGFYYNSSFAAALNGRIIFYGLASCVLWTLFALAIKLVRRLRRRGSASAVGPRALAAVAAVATWVNLDIVAMYVLYERLGIKVKQGLAFPALVGLPALLVTAALLLVLIYLSRRPGRAKAVLRTAGRIILAAGVALGAFSYGLKYYRSWSRAKPAELPDVVFITSDAWRADAFNAEFSPEILTFAERDGVIFGRARSTAPCTLQSFAGALTGSYNVTRCDSMEYKESLRTTWAQVMWARGYDTYAVLSNPYLDTVRLLHRGFAHYDYADFNPLLAAVRFYDTAWYFAIRGSAFEPEVPGTTSRRLTDKTLAVLRKKTPRPKFVWVHYLDPHYPYQPSDAVLRENAPDLLIKTAYGTDRSKLDAKNVRTIKELYDYEVKTTDGYVARLWAELAARPNTLVIISSDHGEEFSEHGQFEHRKTLYDEVIRVPLIISLPKDDRGRFTASRVSAPISLIDVAPSTLTYLGFPVPGKMEGRTDIITGSAPEERGVYSTLWHPDGYFLATLVKGDKKIIEKIKGGETTFEYFDLAADPGERNPLPLDDTGEGLRDNVAAWVRNHVNFRESGVDEAQIFGDRADLKALGYVQ
ncbi:MAG TPA: sulfatase [bacterium]|nr:sulfatase [bacterium]